MGGGSRGGQSHIEGAEKAESSQEKRVPRRKKKETTCRGEESLAEIEAWWITAYKAEKENAGVWPACSDGSM